MIQLHNISKQYNGISILRTISCTIEHGTTTLLLGENGAGKSTLLKIIAGIEDSPTGSIRINESEQIGYLGHSSAMYPRLTAIENLLFWAKLYKKNISKEQCYSILQYVAIYNARNKEVRFFSRGMIQRLNIANILLQEPSILLLDEPFAGLDSTSTQLLYKIIQEAQNKNNTILWITHSPEKDIQYAHFILQLEKKTIAFHGSTQEYTKHYCSNK